MRKPVDKTTKPVIILRMKNLILAKNKLKFDQLKKVATPNGTDSFQPIPHADLVERTRKAISDAGFSIEHEEHATARNDLRYFGGFAITGRDIAGADRKLVVGLRNSNDKSFAASICLGTSMMVCENLCFSADIKLSRRHTTYISDDIPRVLANAVSKATEHWANFTQRIEAYKAAEVENVERMVVRLVDAKALPARDIYKTVEEFRNPRHAEFKGGSFWTLYNAVTENLKGGDLTKLPQRTMTAQSIFDGAVGYEAAPIVLAN